ncbi:uncharacterized protein ofcc1 isoform 2-T2 [Spinachia spinachia]
MSHFDLTVFEPFLSAFVFLFILFPFSSGREQRDALVGIENPGFDGGGSTEISAPPAWPGREMRGDRPDSTLAAHGKKTELRAPSKERGNERCQNDFDPSAAEQTDPRHSRMAGFSAGDELELTTLNADGNRLYQGMSEFLDEEDTFINIPGTLPAFRDEEVLEVKAGDPVLEQRLLLHSGGGASGSGPSQTNTAAKTQAGACAVPGGEAGRRAGRMQAAQKGPLKRREWAKRKKRLMAVFAGNVTAPQTQRDCDEAVSEAPRPRLDALLQRSTTSENPSLSALGKGQEEEEATAEFGQVTERPESSSSASRPPWLVTQSTTPQPVEVCVCCLRAARDKLPKGSYSVSVALHSRLGAPALAWCSKQEQRGASTEPVAHRGRFWDTDVHFNQSLLMLLPAACEVVPSMVLVFQLISLPGDSSHVSSVLAWGAFPVCGPSLGLVQGRFKTPLLRGEPSTQLDQFKKIEAIISSDLDHWLCNLYFQVKRLPSRTYGGPERCVNLSTPSLYPPVVSQTQVNHDQPRSRLPLQAHLPTRGQLTPQPIPTQPQICPQQQGQASPPGCILTGGSPLHLSADSACSSSSLPGNNSSWGANSGNTREKSAPCSEKAEGGTPYKKKPIKKTNSRGPSVSGGAPPLQAGKQKMQPSTENRSKEEMEEYTFSLHSAPTGYGPRLSRLSERARLALSMLPSELGLPLPGQQRSHGSWRCSARQLGLIMLLLALMWFVRLYLHYCSQWLYLQAIAVPVNKFQFHAHTVDLVYQSSLLHTREELAMVVVGPLTLNAVTFLLVLIRWGCQQMFGSLPSFTSEFIMAQGVWTVLDPLAVFAVDAVLGRLAYSPDTPVGDAAKLYWHFYRVDQSGAGGVIITLFLYTVLLLLSITILSINILRFHNDGRMLDVFQRLTATEGKFFLPQDLELSNQELSYIVKKAEQWRGFNGERRKVIVYDYIWTVEKPLAGVAASTAPPRDGATLPEGETSTHVAVYTLYLSGLKQRYRHFLRQPDGAIVEVIGDMEGLDCAILMVPGPVAPSGGPREEEEGAQQLRKRKKAFGRSNRVEPVGGSGCGSSLAPQDLQGELLVRCSARAQHTER